MRVSPKPFSSRSYLGALLAAFVASAIGPASIAAPAAAAPVAPGPPVTIDGPGSGVLSVNGLSIARDGTGGVVYLKTVSGVAHVFVSRLLGGAFGPPEQLDGSFSGGSSEPVIAAGNGGVLLVAFVNGGSLYAVDRLSPSAAPGAPIPLAGGAAHPSIQMTNFGKAYLAFTVDAGGGNHDVRAAYYNKGIWALASSPLDAAPGDDAGNGAGRPAVAASGDGVGTVVWGEGGHIYSRRVWGTAPSVVYEQADVGGLAGWTEVSADSPVAGVGGDSSYVPVEFREVFKNGAQQQSRVLMRRLRGSQYEGVTEADGASTPGLEGASAPQIALGEYGSGVATAAHDTSNQLFATVLAGSGLPVSTFRLDSLTNASPPFAVPAMAGLFSDLVAWQHDPGLGGGPPEIRVRYADDGENFGPEMTVSSPAQGPTEAASGLLAAGDVAGDAAIAWVQGSGSAARVMAAQLFRAPGSFSPVASFAYSRSRHPVLAWNPPNGRWGPIRYLVTVDGSVVGQTTSSSLAVPRTLRDGPHRWRVTAINPAGEQSATGSARVWVDAVPPAAKLTLPGAGHVGSGLRARFSYTDAPRGEPRADASGIAQIVIRWGDGAVSKLHRGSHVKSHSYRRRGRFKVTLLVKDRAGNRTAVVRFVRVR